MATANLQFDTRGLAWREFWRTLAPGLPGDCIHLRNLWYRIRFSPHAVRIGPNRFCANKCLDTALAQSLRPTRLASPRPSSAHRVPLGLLLLSRRQLTVEQLQSALEAQRSAPHSKIGEWLQRFGYVNEQQVTAALARQWSCPVLHPHFAPPHPEKIPIIPVTLLATFTMLPLDYIEATSTLHLACSESIDYSVLYAIEQMLGCHTEPCMALPSFVRSQLELRGQHPHPLELLFPTISDLPETRRIIRSYCDRLSPSEIRIAHCGPYLWVRLLHTSREPLDLLFHSSSNSHRD